MVALYNNTPLFLYQSDINQIAKPLFDNSEIDFFCFTRFYPDNSIILLSSFPKLNHESVETKSIITYSQLDNLLEKNKHINMINNCFYCLLREDNKKADLVAKKYGLNMPIVIVDKQHS